VPADDSEGLGGIELVMGREPSPALACELAETCRVRLEQLGDKTLQAIALQKMEGYTNHEIAAQLNVTVRTVERKLMRIRRRWENVSPS
jgi:DNA-directed RNA polymerase specialized sigma24 family protein